MLTDDLIATFSSAQAAFTERVHAVAPDQWQLGTPDTQWAVAVLVGHLVDEHRWAAPLLAGLDMAAARAVVAGLDIVDRTPAGMFDPPVGAGADAPVIDRLVALTGRRPRPA
jgi:Mycothiol maleylpyruvate isomerase N-terminal domain